MVLLTKDFTIGKKDQFTLEGVERFFSSKIKAEVTAASVAYPTNSQTSETSSSLHTSRCLPGRD
jgi:hypothetical protein